MPRRALLVAAALYTVLALIVTFPLILHLRTALPHDPGDPLLTASILWWNAHVLPLTARWWDGWAFYPSTGMLAFSDHRLGLSLIATPLQWLGASPITAYNVVFLATFPLCALAAHALGATLTGRHDAAAICGLAFGFNPFRVAHISHLELLAGFAMPMALVALHLYVRDRRPSRIVLLAASLVVLGLSATYYLLFFFVLLGLWVVWFVRPREWRVAAAIAAAVAAAVLVLLPIAIGYSRVHAQYGFTRLAGEMIYYSADLHNFLTASPLMRLWGFTGTTELNAERQVFPGLIIVLLAAAGAVAAFRAREATGDEPFRRTRVALLAGACVAVLVAISFLIIGRWEIGVGSLRLLLVTDPFKPTTAALALLTAALALGPTFRGAWQRRSIFAFYVIAAVFLFVCAMGPAPALFGEQILYPSPYDLLMRLPGFSSARAPARFVMVGVLALGAAAALAFDRLFRRSDRRALAATAALAGLVAESWMLPLAMAPVPKLWPMPTRVQFGPVIELPVSVEFSDFIAMYRGTLHGHPVVNGNSGFLPREYVERLRLLRDNDASAFETLVAHDALLVVIDKATDPDQQWRRLTSSAPGAELLEDDARWTIFIVPPAR